MTITQTGLEGGVIESELLVQPRYTFVDTSNPADIRVFDTGLEGMPEFRFTIHDMPWAVPSCHPSVAFAPDGICASEDTDGPVTSQFAVIEGLEGSVWNLRPAASPQFATVTLIKQVVNDDSGTAVVSDFDLFLQDRPQISS